MRNIIINLLDWIYKKKCYICGCSKNNLKVCQSCFEDIEQLKPESNRKLLNCDVFCASLYENIIQKLIRGLKYHNQKDLAYFQAKFMFEYWQNIPNKKETYQIVPIPLYKEREKKRKYNHMNLVAEEFSKLTGYCINTSLVKRIKNTKPQYKLSKTQRMENLNKAFQVDINQLKEGEILLIDDICTTGATFENIILELNKQNIKNITCFATATPIEH